MVVAPQPESIERLLRRVAEDNGSPIHFARPFELLESRPLSPDEVPAGELPVLGERVAGRFRDFDFEAHLPLSGAHQAVNAAIAGLACELLRPSGRPLPRGVLKDGLERVAWPARVELVGTHPWEVIDCAHNQPSMRALMRALQRHLRWERMIVVLGASRDKPVEAMAQEMGPADHVVLTEAALSRAMPVELLEERTARHWRSHDAIISPVEALCRARELAGPRDLICVTGSVFLVGDLLESGEIDSRLCEL